MLDDPDGGTTTYSYDSGGRLTGLQTPWGERTSWAYDGGSRLATLTLGNGATVTYTYDAASRTTGVRTLRQAQGHRGGWDCGRGLLVHARCGGEPDGGVSVGRGFPPPARPLAGGAGGGHNAPSSRRSRPPLRERRLHKVASGMEHPQQQSRATGPSPPTAAAGCGPRWAPSEGGRRLRPALAAAVATGLQAAVAADLSVIRAARTARDRTTTSSARGAWRWWADSPVTSWRASRSWRATRRWRRRASSRATSGVCTIARARRVVGSSRATPPRGPTAATGSAVPAWGLEASRRGSTLSAQPRATGTSIGSARCCAPRGSGRAAPALEDRTCGSSPDPGGNGRSR